MFATSLPVRFASFHDFLADQLAEDKLAGLELNRDERPTTSGHHKKRPVEESSGTSKNKMSRTSSTSAAVRNAAVTRKPENDEESEDEAELGLEQDDEDVGNHASTTMEGSSANKSTNNGRVKKVLGPLLPGMNLSDFKDLPGVCPICDDKFSYLFSHM